MELKNDFRKFKFNIRFRADKLPNKKSFEVKSKLQNSEKRTSTKKNQYPYPKNYSKKVSNKLSKTIANIERLSEYSYSISDNLSPRAPKMLAKSRSKNLISRYASYKSPTHELKLIKSDYYDTSLKPCKTMSKPMRNLKKGVAKLRSLRSFGNKV